MKIVAMVVEEGLGHLEVPEAIMVELKCQTLPYRRYGYSRLPMNGNRIPRDGSLRRNHPLRVARPHFQCEWRGHTLLLRQRAVSYDTRHGEAW